jgi:hypothetical protein
MVVPTIRAGIKDHVKELFLLSNLRGCPARVCQKATGCPEAFPFGTSGKNYFKHGRKICCGMCFCWVVFFDPFASPGNKIQLKGVEVQAPDLKK